MKRIIASVCFSLFLVLVASKLHAEIRVLPAPKFVKEENGIVKFDKVRFEFSEGADDNAALDELSRFFKRDIVKDNKAGTLTIEAHLLQKGVNSPMVDVPAPIVDSVYSSEEGYYLIVDREGVRIFASSKAGIFYGVVTFLQLVTKEKGKYLLPDVTIADYPGLKMRGISDDISRGQISTLSNFKKIIRFLAMYKMNIYMPYIEDEFDFKSFPDFSKGRAPLTSKEVAELDAYAKLYHVEIIPIFETLGHMEDVLLKTEFEKYAEFPGATCVNVSSDSTYDFMKSLLSEIAPAFSSSYFNMAADESFDVGLGASKRLVDSLGVDVVHAAYYKRVYDILKSLDKKVLMYGDIILKNPQILSEIPKDIIIVDWQYEGTFDYPEVQKFRNAGFRFIVSPAVWNFTGPFPNFYNSYANIQYFTSEGYKAGAVGVIVSTWNDNGAAELRELNYPGYAWGAECAWNPDMVMPMASNRDLVSPPVTLDEFENIFFHQYFGTTSDLPRIIYELLSSTTNQISWYEFWRAPFVSVPSYNVPLRISSIESSMPEVLSLIAHARHLVTANNDILDLYELVANINKYWADKITGVMKMRETCVDSLMSLSDKERTIRSIEHYLLNSLEKLENNYTKLYLRTNRYPMLQLIKARFDDQKKSLEAGTEQLLGGNCGFDQLIKSNFIYYPGSRPNNHSSTKVDSATFFRAVELENVPDSSLLQLIGDTYCKLFINGKFVGDVKARRTLTWNVERQRIKVFEITKFLHKGKNVFAVQAANYNPNGSAGCNIFAQIGGDTLVTDSSWKVVKGIVSPDVIPNDILSKNAAIYDNGSIISAPMFSLGLKSWYER
jgi:hypothetical protein